MLDPAKLSGDLNKIERLVKTMGIVNCTADFDQQPGYQRFQQLMMITERAQKGRKCFGHVR